MSLIYDIKQVIGGQLDRNLADVGEETQLQELGLESLDMIEMMFALEDRFGIDLPFNANYDGSELQTVKDVIAMVESAIAKRATA